MIENEEKLLEYIYGSGSQQYLNKKYDNYNRNPKNLKSLGLSDTNVQTFTRTPNEKLNNIGLSYVEKPLLLVLRYFQENEIDDYDAQFLLKFIGRITSNIFNFNNVLSIFKISIGLLSNNLLFEKNISHQNIICFISLIQSILNIKK